MIKIENIQKMNLNGKAVKAFDVYRLAQNFSGGGRDGLTQPTSEGWVFDGREYAPAKIANKRLSEWFIQQ